MNEAERCHSRNAIPPNLPGVQTMEAVDRPGRFIERMDLVRRMLILTIDGRLGSGSRTCGRPYPGLLTLALFLRRLVANVHIKTVTSCR